MPKLGNEYATAMGRLYANTPKAVFAAVALSYAHWAYGREAKDFPEAVGRFLEEWRILHENGIVPQAPPRDLASGDGSSTGASKDVPEEGDGPDAA